METNEKTIWVNLPEDEKLTILSNIAEEKGIHLYPCYCLHPITIAIPCMHPPAHLCQQLTEGQRCAIPQRGRMLAS